MPYSEVISTSHKISPNGINHYMYSNELMPQEALQSLSRERSGRESERNEKERERDNDIMFKMPQTIFHFITASRSGVRYVIGQIFWAPTGITCSVRA